MFHERSSPHTSTALPVPTAPSAGPPGCSPLPQPRLVRPLRGCGLGERGSAPAVALMWGAREPGGVAWSARRRNGVSVLRGAAPPTGHRRLPPHAKAVPGAVRARGSSRVPRESRRRKGADESARRGAARHGRASLPRSRVPYRRDLLLPLPRLVARRGSSAASLVCADSARGLFRRGQTLAAFWPLPLWVFVCTRATHWRDC